MLLLYITPYLIYLFVEYYVVQTKHCCCYEIVGLGAYTDVYVVL